MSGRPQALLGAGLLVLLAAGCDRTPPSDETVERPVEGARVAGAGAPSGEDLYVVCQGCHTIAEGAEHGVGPNLHGIVGRQAASRPGYRYSEALSRSGLTWSPGLLRGYIMNAESMVPGTWMAYRNVLAPAEVDRLLEYLAATAPPAADGAPIRE